MTQQKGEVKMSAKNYAQTIIDSVKDAADGVTVPFILFTKNMEELRDGFTAASERKMKEPKAKILWMAFTMYLLNHEAVEEWYSMDAIGAIYTEWTEYMKKAREDGKTAEIKVILGATEA